MIVDNKSTETRDLPKKELKDMKVKTELRPMMRKVVDFLQEMGMEN